MNQPMASIDGDLALPMLRPFDGVPPPFGAYGRAVKAAVKKTVRHVANAESNRRFLATTKHIFFYQTSLPQGHNGHFDAALAEAKRYLSMDTVRYSSSQLDYALGAAIFAGCSLGFCLLLAMSPTPNIENMKPRVAKVIASPGSHVFQGSVSKIAPVKTSASTQGSLVTVAAAPLDRMADMSTQSVDSARGDQSPINQSVVQEHPARSEQKAKTQVDVARMTEAGVKARVALSRPAHPATHPSISAQPEWKTQQSDDAEASQRTEWVDWGARGHRVPVQVYSAPSDERWNDYMTQRRISDDPAAFHVAQGAR